MSTDRLPVVYGATGFTGRLVARAAARRGLSCILAGRDASRLEALARTLEPRPGILVADASDRGALRAMAERASIVLSTVGPFAHYGRPVVEACVEAGAHYVDSTGEQAWMAEVYDDFDALAREKGLVLCPSLAFEVAVADCAAALAAKDLEEVHKVSIVYLLAGFGTSRGTRATAVAQLRHGGWQYVDGARREARLAEDVRRIHLTGVGDRRVVSFPSGEVMTVPRHLPVREVRTYASVPSYAAPLLSRLAPALTALVRTAAGERLESLLARHGRAPDPASRANAHVTIVAVAHGLKDGRTHARTVSARLVDPYGLTGEIMVEGAQSILDGRAAPGARAPAEVVGDPAAFLSAVGIDVSEHAGDVGV